MNPWIPFVVSLFSAAESIFGIIAFFQNRKDRNQKKAKECELDKFYAKMVSTAQGLNGLCLSWHFSPNSKEFVLSEKLVMCGQLERLPGFPSTYSLKTEKMEPI